ncbi:MAG: amino acid ABC transporter permease, partial [Proteobacteria bacterium]|nr:amino acid ABC transporter permease [Pseudomonadota bacterium]
IGTAEAIMRMAANPVLGRIYARYVQVIRSTPLLIQIYVIYFSLPALPLLGRRLDELEGGIIALGLNAGAYMSEIIRAGIQSVEKGQWEAGDSIGLSRFKVMRYVIMPQAIQRTIPPLAGQLISLVKDSSMVSLISVQDLTYSGTQVAISTRKIFEIWIFIAVVYFVICFSLSLVSRWLERRMGRGLQ